MLGRRERRQPELFVAGSPGNLVPDDHVLVRVDRVLDLAWLSDEVADCYCTDNGRPGIDPEVAVRLMLAGLLLGGRGRPHRQLPGAGDVSREAPARRRLQAVAAANDGAVADGGGSGDRGSLKAGLGGCGHAPAPPGANGAWPGAQVGEARTWHGLARAIRRGLADMQMQACLTPR